MLNGDYYNAMMNIQNLARVWLSFAILHMLRILKETTFYWKSKLFLKKLYI